jgi:hypothetical protein
MHNRKIEIRVTGYKVQHIRYTQTIFRFATAIIWFNENSTRKGYARGDLQDDFPDNLISYDNYLEVFTRNEFMKSQLARAVQLIQARELYLRRPGKR